MNTEQARFNMIEQQIRPWEVLDPEVLALLSRVRREDFVPSAAHALAFFDTEIPLAEGGRDGRIMLAPKVEARLLQALQLSRTDRVLEVGGGSGYMAALLAHQARQVLSLEIDPQLAEFASLNLRRAGLAQAQVRQADGSGGCSAEAPFDAILLSGSVAEVPQHLLDQLAPGGRLVAIVGELPVMRAVRLSQVGPSQFTRTELFDTVAPRLRGFAEPSGFRF